MCPNREYISSPGAQVNKLKRMESLLLAGACPADGRRGLYIRKTVSLAGSFYFGGKYRKNCWIRENGGSVLSE